MRKIIVNVDDNTKVLSITTFSDFTTYHNINAAAFDIRNTDEVTIPECVPMKEKDIKQDAKE